ncbi:NmrA family NAD(P)-binding protein [Nostoc sp.]|uniref:NmrA family NAD(P)-binding protein n=1 Tax=Nostoc sp. TaxID=1180 RepID=UPI003FA5B4BE
MNTQNDKLFLITGATGNTGDTTVRLLLQRGHRVRAFVHRSDARSESLSVAGAEILVGDLLDFHAISSAMRGVTGAYYRLVRKLGFDPCCTRFIEISDTEKHNIMSN